MRKGMYTATVSIIVIAMVMASAFSLVSIAESQEQKGIAKGIVELKWKMQNTEALLGKSISDAIADSGFDNGCTYNQSMIIQKLDDYLSNTASNAFGSCSISNIRVQGNQADTRVNFRLECIEQAGEMKIAYAKTGEFRKSTTYYTGSGCEIDVEDLETGKCEVDKIIGQPVGCGS